MLFKNSLKWITFLFYFFFISAPTGSPQNIIAKSPSPKRIEVFWNVSVKNSFFFLPKAGHDQLLVFDFQKFTFNMFSAIGVY